MSRPYTLHVEKRLSTKTESELAELRAKYRDGVPSEIINHIADKIAKIWVTDDDQEVRIAE
jgi:hypothetical protein